MWRILIVVAVVACGSEAKKPPPPSSPSTAPAIAIVDTTVVPMDREVRLANHTVIVRGDRIEAIGPTASTPVPAGAKTIDGRGRFVIPGLADMHVHTFDPLQLALFATRGVTTIRVLWGAPGAIGARDAIRAGEPRLAPMIYTAGNIVDGMPPVWPGSGVVTTAEEARAEVAAQQRAGYDFVKVYSQLPLDAYRAIVDEAGKRGIRVIGHVPLAVTLTGVLDAKQASIEHLDGYLWAAQRDDSPVRNAKSFKERMVAFRHTDEARLADLVARTKAAGTWNCPTLVVYDRIAKLDRPDAQREEYRYVPPQQLEEWDPKNDFRFRAWTAQDFETARAKAAWDFALVKRLADAGAGILAGTDVGNPWLVPGDSLHDELQLLVAAKLTPYQALAAATRDPARFLGSDTGTIAAGKRADLVLLAADPLVDIRNTTKIAGVMLRGRWLPAHELAAERARIAAIYKGERSRFDGAPALVDKPVFEARYRGRAEISGEERFAVRANPDGTLAVVAETRIDATPDGRYELELGPEGHGTKLRAIGDGHDVVMVRDAGRVKVTGRAGKDTIALDEAIADDAMFGAMPIGADAITYRRVKDLEVGKAQTVQLVVLEVMPAVALRRMSLTFTRLPDAQRTIAGTPVPVRVFEVAVFGHKNTVVLDRDGWPVETTNQLRL